MHRRRKIFIFSMVVLVFSGSFILLSGCQTQAKQQKDIYYCPMHPAYTSDRPGDCPICNMKLVKKEISAQEAVHQHSATEANSQRKSSIQSKDICLLHNCNKLHEGRPCPMLVLGKEGEIITCPICGTYVVDQDGKLEEKKILYWTDPMLPGFKSEKPGKSPMGMDLVPVFEEAGHRTQANGGHTQDIPQGYSPVMLTQQKQQLVGIKTSAVERRRLSKMIRTVGTIAHDPELYQAQAEYLQALQSFQRAQQSTIPEIADQSKRLVESTRIRLKHLGLSDELIAEISTWKEPEHSLLFAHPGEPLWMYAQIYEFELPFIQIGQEVIAQSEALPDKKLSGVVRAVDPMVDAMTRTTRIRVQIDDPLGNLKPDMYLNVMIQVDLGENLVVPKESVFDTGIKKIVFVDQGKGIFEPRDITILSEAEGYFAVQEGVHEGENVVTSGNFLIDSESRLKAAFEGMGEEGSHKH